MSKSRVLIVEDNLDNRLLVAFLLEQGNFEVLQAENGREGLEKARLHHPDLLLLDMSIPEIDGWSLARMLKASPDTQSICIVALTGHTLPSDRKKALEAGCDGYISKPLDTANFVHEVSAYLNIPPQA
jgi:two-component system, cell cycle response regulator DivK